MGKRSDFNDLHTEEGLDVVGEQLRAALSMPDENHLSNREEALPQPELDVYLPGLEWQRNLKRNENGRCKSDPYNVMVILENDAHWQGVLGYSDFSYRIYKRKPPPYEHGEIGEWNDSDVTRLRVWFSQVYDFAPREADVKACVLAVAENNRFHEVREYLNALQWDGNVRLRFWLSTYLGAELTGDVGKYNALVGTYWLIGGVARIMQPPCKVDNVLIFEGAQGIKKSTTLATIARGWFTDSAVTLGDKDTYQLMQGVLIVELAELDAFNKAESTRAKSFFTSQTDRFRPPYGALPKEFPRQCIFAGSTNQETYFKDATGNRRYWPVRCTDIHLDALQEDIDQLWAEAVHRYREGERWWPESNDLELFTAEQSARFDEDVWQQPIQEYLNKLITDETTMHDVMVNALDMQNAQLKPPEQMRVGKILNRLGWKKRRARRLGERIHFYQAPEDWRKVQQNE